MEEAAGKKKWIIPGGHIYLKSNGKEPDLLSQDRIAVLNTGSDPVKLKISVFHSDRDPVEYSLLEIGARRLRKVRINDLIDPCPVFLETDYAIVIEADHNVVVQFMQMNTGQRNAAMMGSISFSADE